jgi:hypothetical protein
MAARSDIEATVAEATRILKRLPGVLSVGYGYKERGGKSTRELSLVVLVREKKPPSALSPDEIVPREVLGIQTDVIRAPRFHDLACENTEKFDPLVGGSLISNLKVFLATNSLLGQGVGTLGHFATNDSSGSRDRIVLLSNNHVLTSGGATTGDIIYQPRFTGTGSSAQLDPKDMHPIGFIENTGLKGNRDYAYPGEAAKAMYVDCATAHVNTRFSSWCLTNCGIKFANVIHSLHEAQGLDSNEVTGVARVTDADLPENDDYVVYKVGPFTGWTRGKIKFATLDTVDPDDETDVRKQLLVLEDLGPNCGGGTPFAEDGDSGAVILNEAHQIIGLLFGGTNSGVYAACHIHPVIDLLGITMVSTQHTAGASGGASALEVSLGVDGTAPDVARAATLRQEVMASELGRQFQALVYQHMEEVSYLLNRVRPVTVAWHRTRGPDFMGHVLHAFRHADYAVPRELAGQGRADAVSRMLETLSRHGTAALRADIERHAEQVRCLLADSDDLETVAARIRTRQASAK